MQKRLLGVLAASFRREWRGERPERRFDQVEEQLLLIRARTDSQPASAQVLGSGHCILILEMRRFEGLCSDNDTRDTRMPMYDTFIIISTVLKKLRLTLIVLFGSVLVLFLCILHFIFVLKSHNMARCFQCFRIPPSENPFL